MIKSDPRNVGKSVSFIVKRGDERTERIGRIKSFRGGRYAHAAWIEYRTPVGSYRLVSVEMHALSYV